MRAALALALCAAASAEPAPKPNPGPVWSVEGLEQPAGAHYDARSAAIYVSSARGIAKLDADGRILADPWAAGFKSPKGLKTCGGKLLVADVDVIIALSLSTGGVLGRWPLRDAKGLSGVAVDSDCVAYVCDAPTKRVYRVGAGGQASIVAEGPALTTPGGLAVEANAIVVAGDRLLRLDLATKKVSAVPGPMGRLAGPLRWKDGWLVSDAAAGLVLRVSSSGATSVLLQGLRGAGDLGLVPARPALKTPALLLVPRPSEGRLDAYAL